MDSKSEIHAGLACLHFSMSFPDIVFVLYLGTTFALPGCPVRSFDHLDQTGCIHGLVGSIGSCGLPWVPEIHCTKRSSAMVQQLTRSKYTTTSR